MSGAGLQARPLGRLAALVRGCASAAAPAGAAVLRGSRAVLGMSGPDTERLLQGLVTNDVRGLAATGSGPPRPLYAGILTPQGRVLHDLILHAAPDNGEKGLSVYLDVAAGSVDDLLRYLRRHKLRSRVDLHDLTSHKVVAAAWPGAGAPPAAWAASLPGDPRVAALGRRGIIEAGAAPAPDDDDNAAAERVYKYVRALCGVAEGPAEIPPGEALPLEFNMDGMAGVSYTKGCYVGQELTARTHYTGVVRKRVVPIALDGDGAEVAPGAKVYAEGSKRAAGKILATCAAPAGAGGAVGLALLRLAAVLPADAPPLVVEGGGVAVRATRPEWWPAEWGHEEDDAQQAGQAV